ncbi:unnamed protein product [Schistosoma rodhaini]|uniref:EF-hand domain-containing protein n=1 Tax=Schistosoma rodhaini TaxID=6188 RepID=A0AA85F626_9TREM|nr:unnamed protein product [Schistosoma rodhaini]
MVLQDEDYVNFRPGGTHVKKTIEPEHAEKDQQENKKYGKWSTVRKLVTGASQHINTSQMLRLSSIFSVLAQHHKSVITAGDILLVMRALGDALTEAELQDLIFELDVDRDGKLDFSELCAFVVERIYKKKLDHDFEELFQLLDQDVLTETSYGTVFNTSGCTLKESEYGYLIMLSDISRNNLNFVCAESRFFLIKGKMMFISNYVNR